MEIITNTETTEHANYTQFLLKQLVASMEIGDTVELKLNGETKLLYTTQYINCNVNMVVQDKGIKEESTL